MAKRKNLADSITAANIDQVEKTVPAEVESTSKEATTEIAKSQPTTKSKKPPSRINTKAITGHFDPSISKQLKMFAITQDSSIQELLREAINDLFVKYGKNPIA